MHSVPWSSGQSLLTDEAVQWIHAVDGEECELSSQLTEASVPAPLLAV
jgi:hypothetical protein